MPFNHACHTGNPYVNGHYFISLTLSVPVLSQREGDALHIRYLAVSIGYRMWAKEKTKLDKMRWAVKTNYYDQKAFWLLNAYWIRRQNGIKHGVNLVTLVHNSLKMLPYLDEHFFLVPNASPQKLRSHIS